MMTPPMHMIGAMILRLTLITASIWTCWTSLVVRVINDGAPNFPISRWEKSFTPVRKVVADVAPGSHGRACPEIDGDDTAEHLGQRDRKHDDAGVRDAESVSPRATP